MRGALLFYGEGGCVGCHTGPLFTDQQYHTLAVPQLGPGKERDGQGNVLGIDYGRFRETGNRQEQYAFRTPPLHNVAATAPYMHNGAYATLEAVIIHHMRPQTALENYDPGAHLPPLFRETYNGDDALQNSMLARLDEDLAAVGRLNDAEIADLSLFWMR